MCIILYIHECLVCRGWLQCSGSDMDRCVSYALSLPLLHSCCLITATATKETYEVILKHLKMTQECIIQLSPKDHTSDTLLSRSKVNHITFRWLLDDLRAQRRTMPRVFMFCQSITTCTQLYILFLSELQEHSYDPPSSTPEGIVCSVPCKD